MAREQKGKHKTSQNSGKKAAQSSQQKKQQQEAIVAPQLKQETVVAPQQPPEVTTSQQEQETVVAPQQPQDSIIAPVAPTWPVWPTSKPGPRSTPPPPGMHAFNVFRPEQFSEVGYNQETGEPGSHSPLRSLPDASMKDQVSFDQQPDETNILSRRKKRL